MNISSVNMLTVAYRLWQIYNYRYQGRFLDQLYFNVGNILKLERNLNFTHHLQAGNCVFSPSLKSVSDLILFFLENHRSVYGLYLVYMQTFELALAKKSLRTACYCCYTAAPKVKLRSSDTYTSEPKDTVVLL